MVATPSCVSMRSSWTSCFLCLAMSQCCACIIPVSRITPCGQRVWQVETVAVSVCAYVIVLLLHNNTASTNPEILRVNWSQQNQEVTHYIEQELFSDIMRRTDRTHTRLNVLEFQNDIQISNSLLNVGVRNFSKDGAVFRSFI